MAILYHRVSTCNLWQKISTPIFHLICDCYQVYSIISSIIVRIILGIRIINSLSDTVIFHLHKGLIIDFSLLQSHLSRVQLCVIPQMAAHQAPPSLVFSRQEHWSELPFPSPMHESEVAQSCRLLVTPWTAAYQAPPSMGFSRQEYRSGVPLPSPRFFSRVILILHNSNCLLLMK